MVTFKGGTGNVNECVSLKNTHNIRHISNNIGDYPGNLSPYPSVLDKHVGTVLRPWHISCPASVGHRTTSTAISPEAGVGRHGQMEVPRWEARGVEHFWLRLWQANQRRAPHQNPADTCLLHSGGARQTKVPPWSNY